MTVSGTMQAISETGLDLDRRSTNAEGADWGIGIATLLAHVAMTLALDDVPIGPVAEATCADRNPKLLILHGIEF